MASNTGASRELILRQRNNLRAIEERKIKAEVEAQEREEEEKQLGIAKVNMDFDEVINKAKELLTDQALLTQNSEDINLKSLALTKAKSNSFLDALSNIISVSHLNMLLKADKLKFKREDELDAMNTLLRASRLAATASEQNMAFIVRQIGEVLQDLNSGEEMTAEERQQKIEIISALQVAYGGAISNMNQVTAGLKTIVQLERWSGGRPWGSSKSAPVMISSELLGDWNNKGKENGYSELGGNGEVRPRQLTPKEVIAMEAGVDLEEDDEDEDFRED